MGYLYLFVAIVGEVVGTSALKASDEFTRLWPSLLVLICYAIAFFFLALTLRTLPVGIAYAIWSGLGTAAIVVAGAVIYGQHPDLAAVIGVALIVAGVIIVNSFSSMSVH